MPVAVSRVKRGDSSPARGAPDPGDSSFIRFSSARGIQWYKARSGGMLVAPCSKQSEGTCPVNKSTN